MKTEEIVMSGAAGAETEVAASGPKSEKEPKATVQPDKPAPSKPAPPKPTKAAKEKKPKPAKNAPDAKPDKPSKPTKKTAPAKKPGGLSGLDAAAKVLAGATEPMRCGDLVEKVLAKGLWKSKGKTPAATIHAAIIREIRDKGKTSRFRKVGRGMFSAGATM